MDQGRFDRLAAGLGAVSRRRGVAADLCAAFCSGANEQPFGVNDNIGGFANFCGADNKCKVKECPVRL